MALIINSCGFFGPDPSLTQKINKGWQFKEADSSTWYPAKVPGTVHTDLLQNNLIGDPFYRTNELDLQWIEKKDWEYKTNFIVDDNILGFDNVDLLFDGLDTYADVYLNDSLILSANNMFVGWNISCKKFLRKGKNSLLIRFTSPITKTVPEYDSLGYELPAGNDRGEKKVSVFTRKAPYQYGWDWGPRFVTSGIWRPVKLTAWNKAKISDLHIIQNSLNDSVAEMTAVFNVKAAGKSSANVFIQSDDDLFASADTDVDLRQGENTVAINFEIKNPRRWWPNGLGKQYLYKVTGGIESGYKTIDSKKNKIGLRTLKVVNKKDSIGESFYVEVNGVPVFMKGANYIPLDSFVPRVDTLKYNSILNDVKDANMNMLRVWGGGIYENNIFYDLCDEKGILVFQDFMFACSMYPGGKAFFDNVKEEAAYNIKRLRNHPCIALWCGNNEISEGWHNWGWQKEFGYSQADSAEIWNNYRKIFNSILPEAVAEFDSARFYWPSSPEYGYGRPESLTSGDMHYWGVWHGEQPFSFFKKYTGRFMSEYGFQSFPEFKTVDAFTLPQDLNINSKVMLSHQKNSRGNMLITEYMKRAYNMPKDFESFLYVSQVLQAEGMKIGFESHRRKMPYCMGTLFWQLDDCWPVASWSGIDYYGRWKALHYFAKKAYKDILVSPEAENDTLSVYIVSDRLSPLNGILKLSLIHFNGNVLFEEILPVKIKANTSKIYFTKGINDLLKNYNKNDIVFSSELFFGDSIVSTNNFYFVPPKKLNLSYPVIKKVISKNGDNYSIELSTDKLARNVYLSLKKGDGFFSDNYFDMIPGKKYFITFTPKGNAVNLKSSLNIISLVNSYK